MKACKREPIEEYVDSRLEFLKKKHNIPEDLEEDIRQEIAVAALERVDVKDAGQVNVFIEGRVKQYLRREQYYTDTTVLHDSLDMCRVGEQCRQVNESIETICKHLDGILVEYGKMLGIEARTDDRYRVMVKLILQTHNANINHSGVAARYSEVCNVSRTIGQVVLHKLIKKLRNKKYSQNLRNYYYILEDISDCKDEISSIT